MKQILLNLNPTLYKQMLYKPTLYKLTLYKQTTHKQNLTEERIRYLTNIINLSIEKSIKLFVETNKQLKRDHDIKKLIYGNAAIISANNYSNIKASPYTSKLCLSNMYFYLLYLGIGSLSLLTKVYF